MSGFPPECGSIRPRGDDRRGGREGPASGPHPTATRRPPAQAGASSSILCEGSAKLSSVTSTMGEARTNRRPSGRVQTKVRGDGRGGLRGREDTRDRPSRRHELRPSPFITTPTSSACQANQSREPDRVAPDHPYPRTTLGHPTAPGRPSPAALPLGSFRPATPARMPAAVLITCSHRRANSDKFPAPTALPFPFVFTIVLWPPSSLRVAPGGIFGSARRSREGAGSGMTTRSVAGIDEGAESSRRAKGRFGRFRLLAAGIATVLAAVLGITVSRLRSLDGIPDVGDPFDVARAMRPVEIPDSDNAYVLYGEAHAQLTRLPPSLARSISSALTWSKSGQAVRDYLEQNRAAMETWRQGSERPDATLPSAGRAARSIRSCPWSRTCGRWCAWAAWRARGWRSRARWIGPGIGIGRCCGAAGWWAGTECLIERGVGSALHKEAARRIVAWAADPRVDARHAPPCAR